MKIDSSTVNMGSARNYKATSVTFRRFMVETRQAGASGSGLHAAVGGNAGSAEKGEKEQEGQNSLKAQEGQNTRQVVTGQGTGSSENSQAVQTAEGEAGTENETSQTSALQDWQGRLQQTSSNVSIRSSVSQTLAEIRQSTIRYIFDLLFSYRRNRLGRWMGDNGMGTAQSWNTSQSNLQGTGNQDTARQQLNSAPVQTNIKVLNYTHETFQIEREDTAFSTVGTVRTADGREIQFNVNVGMSREFQQHYQEQLEEAFVFCDPLVINLDTDIAELSDQTFYFDIDGDGEMDEISGMGAGSGYLALDKNEDGIINDGSELFGTSSGNGFADLAKYDEDGNGWIDENDAIWDKLKIWCKDEKGQDVLYKLADKGVGAICLQNVSTDFTLKGQQGRTKGAIRNSGVFLYENGNVGTVQHVDVAKYSAQA